MKLKEMGLGSSLEGHQQKARLAKYGYTVGAKQEEYNREAVLSKMQELAKVQPEVEEELMLWWEHYADEIEAYDELYLVTPVMLAMLLKEYELAEKLIDMGYWANDLLLCDQVYCEAGPTNWCIHLYISQLLTSQEDIPERLFYKICDEISVTKLDYVTDYWKNPFLMTSPEIITHKKIPSMKGLQRVWEYDREILRGIMDSVKDNSSSYLPRDSREYLPQNSREWKKLFGNLSILLRGLEEDLETLIDQFAPGNSGSSSLENDPKFRRFWIKMLPELKISYSENEESQKLFFEHLAKLYCKLCTDGESVNSKQNEKQALEVLKLLKVSCPEWYTFEDYMEFLKEHIHWDFYADMTGLWKQCIKKNVQFEKLNESFWMMLGELFGKKVEVDMDNDDYEMDISYRMWNTDQRIAKSISFLEELDENNWKYNASDINDREAVSYLISTLLDFGSEELFMTCMKIKLLPKEILPIAIKCAFRFGRKELLPILLLYQNRTYEG